MTEYFAEPEVISSWQPFVNFGSQHSKIYALMTFELKYFADRVIIVGERENLFTGHKKRSLKFEIIRRKAAVLAWHLM